ncbi:MAG: 50S ribosomal protein L29 [Bacteroidia bacterium]|nr:50S ribosomal protein L29 [Bacteroidia bacterium]
MKAKEIKQMSTGDLREKITQEKESYVKMAFNHSVSPLDSPIRLRITRRTIARLATELRLRELTEKANKK